MSRRIRLLAVLLTLGLGLATAAALTSQRSAPAAAGAPPVRGIPQISLVAVGDTGKPRTLWSVYQGQLAVARAIESLDRRRPIDALLLLGDNFYGEGLQGEEFVQRIRSNVVEPYCRFVELSRLWDRSGTAACPPERRRHPVPILAVLGNHDHASRASPALQREAVPLFVPNWHVPAGAAESVELGHGVSLVLFDSDPLRDGASTQELVEALRASRGPWRILVGHHPMALGRSGAANGSARDRRFARSVRGAIDEAGVPVQLSLAGHRHDLELITMKPPAPTLNVIAGSGARIRHERRGNGRQVFAAQELGFARVDLVSRAGSEVLVVSLFATEPYPSLQTSELRLLARWSVTREGRLQDDLGGAPPARSRAAARVELSRRAVDPPAGQRAAGGAGR